MFALNDNEQWKQFRRFMDISDEPLTTMTPIKGYEKMPLVSLEQAIQPLIPHIPEIEQMIDVAKKRCEKPPPDNLTEDQSAAIMLYTMEWEPREDSVYQRLNKALRTEDRQTLKPWFSYLKLLVTALSLLPANSRTVFRGIKSDEGHRYKEGEKVVWWGFSSCTSKQDVLKHEAFMGPSGKRTMFTIECQTGKDIRNHSYFKNESEVLLPAAREFQVESVFPQADGLCLIHLKEVQPKYPLLETSFIISQIIPSVLASTANLLQLPKTAAQSVSNSPIYKQPLQTLQNQSFGILSNQGTKQDSPVIVGHDPSRKVHDTKYYVLITCGLIFCCPCTAGYLLLKKK